LMAGVVALAWVSELTTERMRDRLLVTWPRPGGRAQLLTLIKRAHANSVHEDGSVLIDRLTEDFRQAFWTRPQEHAALVRSLMLFYVSFDIKAWNLLRATKAELEINRKTMLAELVRDPNFFDEHDAPSSEAEAVPAGAPKSVAGGADVAALSPPPSPLQPPEGGGELSARSDKLEAAQKFIHKHNQLCKRRILVLIQQQSTLLHTALEIIDIDEYEAALRLVELPPQQAQLEILSKMLKTWPRYWSEVHNLAGALIGAQDGSGQRPSQHSRPALRRLP